MNARRWESAKRLFEAAVELPGDERDLFVQRECGGDGALRREVESLLAAHDQAGSFLASVPERGSGIEAGTRLGPYEIVSRIGAGGMGEVWRARDTRLGREVAVKILPPEFAHDAKRQLRFKREARTISHLNHPNICTLFDVGHEDGVDYLVMELLDGESLADRLARGPLPLAEVVRYGVQIAEGLGKAHREGIVHRDLKPANVVLTKGGAKLLDFGLAKSTASQHAGSDATTAEEPLTEEGTVVGTFQYMAPEQVGGEEPDPRSDIFSLGAVLYQMTTGKRAFEGNSRTSVIAAIVSGEPRPICEIQPLTPPALEHVVTKCLRKDRDDRWQSATDVAEELRWIGEAGSQVTLAYAARSPRRERMLWAAGLVVIAALTAAAVLRFARRTPTAGEPIESGIAMDATGGLWIHSGPPALTPDGRALAFSATDKSGRACLWVRSLSDSAPRALANTEGASWPFWSPDGKFIGFTVSGALKKIPAAGGNVDLIAGRGGLSGTWNRDGVILFGRGREGIFRVGAGGGEPTVILKPDSLKATGISMPWFLPDGRHFLFLAYGEALGKINREGVWVGTLDGGEKPRFVTQATARNMSFASPGWLLFARDGALRAQRFDLKSLRVNGDEAVVAPVELDADHKALFCASDSGVLVYLRRGTGFASELRLRNRKGEVLRTYGRGLFYSPRVSNDAKRIAVDVTQQATSGDIWLIGLQDGSTSRFTFEEVNETSPVWSPDDTSVAYSIRSCANCVSWYGRIAVKRLTAGAQIVLDVPNVMVEPTDWSRDGRFLLIMTGRRPVPGSRTPPPGGRDLSVLSLRTHELVDVAATPAIESAAVFSPDTKWVAYQSNESGRAEIYVQPFPATGAKYQVSRAGGHWPRWRMPDEITYVDEADHLTTVRVKTVNDFAADPPRTLPVTIDSHGGSLYVYYDLTPDGNIVEAALVHDNPPPLTMVTNWDARLRK